MGVYTRYKRDEGGFRKLVELLESTPESRRQKMIELGMAEDPWFTKKALEYMYSFKDILALQDVELAEVLDKAPPRISALAIGKADDTVKKRFLRNSKARIAAEMKSYFDTDVPDRERAGAQMKMITVARDLERVGKVRSKRIPLRISPEDDNGGGEKA